jgi:hypothetical protein
MGQGRRDVENHPPVKRVYWGVRPWKRHDLILTVAGTIYSLVGIAYIIADDSPARYVALQVLLTLAPLRIWGGVFVAAGLMCIISSRWPPFADTWGYVVLTGMSVGWGSAYLFSILLGPSPWTNINGFFLWTLLGFLWWAISGLLNPDRTGVTDASTGPH